MADQRVTIGIDLGGTQIKAGLVDDDGSLIRSVTRPTNLSKGGAGLIADMAAMIEGLLDGEGGGPGVGRVPPVGLGSPGPLSPRAGRIYKCGNLPGLEGFPIRDALRDAIGAPVTLDNDGNVAALGEYWVGGGRGTGDMVMLTLGTGVGGGVIVDGRVLHGHFENAAELGHMIVQPGGLPCPCGQSGCLERYASASSVARRGTEAMRGGGAKGLAAKVGPDGQLTSEHVVEAARQGDEACGRVWDEACLYLAVACINIQHTLNPQRIVIGGGMSAAGDFLFDAVHRHFDQRRWSLAEDFPQIVPARLGNDAGIFGAARLARTPA